MNFETLEYLYPVLFIGRESSIGLHQQNPAYIYKGVCVFEIASDKQTLTDDLNINENVVITEKNHFHICYQPKNVVIFFN